MNTDIKLSTRFHQAQGAHEVGVLVGLAGASLDSLVAEPSAREEAADLRRQAERMRARLYEAADRKYHLARSRSARENKDEYLARTRRKP